MSKITRDREWSHLQLAKRTLVVIGVDGSEPAYTDEARSAA